MTTIRRLIILVVILLMTAPAQAQRPEPFAELHLPYAVIYWFQPEPNQQTEFPYGRALIENVTTGETFTVMLWASDCDPVVCTWRGHISPEYGKSYHIEYAELWLSAGNIWLSTGWQSDSQQWRQTFLPGVVR